MNNAQHLVVRDISLQGTRLALPGAAEDSIPAEDQTAAGNVKKRLAPAAYTHFGGGNIACLFTATG